MLKKINDLKRFPFRYRLRLIYFQIRKTLGLGYRKKDYDLNSLLTTHLLRFNGFLIKEDNSTYTVDFYFNQRKKSRITLRKPPSSDFAVFEQVFILNEYQPMVNLLNTNRSEEDSLCILDAGGNTGLTSIFFNNTFPPSKYCIVEPDDENFRMLQKNVNQNKFADCCLVNGGVWDKDCDLEINRNFRDGNDWSVNVTKSSTATDLKGYSISTLMKQAGFTYIDIFKIDIEGSEKQLFSDASHAAEFLSKTKFICIEIHDEFECREEINQCLTKNNFEFFLKDGLTIGINRNLVKQNHKGVFSL